MPIRDESRTIDRPSTLAELEAAGYRPRTVKRELRENTLAALASGRPLFPGIAGYDDTVIPELTHALLSEHDLLLLGLRGQAKTRILRALVNLLDEWIPVIDADGLEIPDDPMRPTTRAGRHAVDTNAGDTKVRWLHRSERLHEKLATPDVTIADLIGEIDLIKHAEGRSLADEATMHFGLVPRSNRGLFILNELPDLAPRIQVGLFNVLEERDIQIRGYPIRLSLDLSLAFSANPEDYTNRGRIVTPLKDRIGSVVRTHYPRDRRLAMSITRENAFVDRHAEVEAKPPGIDHDRTPPEAWAPAERPDTPRVVVPTVIREIIEHTIHHARTSPHVNQASGVSVRASIACLESVVSAAERRATLAGETETIARPCDFTHLPAALRGKIELMMADESADGAAAEDQIILAFLGEATKEVLGDSLELHDVEHLASAFASGLRLELSTETPAADAAASIRAIEGLEPAARSLAEELNLAAESNAHDDHTLACAGELILEFLYVNQRLSKASGPRGGYRR